MCKYKGFNPDSLVNCPVKKRKRSEEYFHASEGYFFWSGDILKTKLSFSKTKVQFL